MGYAVKDPDGCGYGESGPGKKRDAYSILPDPDLQDLWDGQERADHCYRIYGFIQCSFQFIWMGIGFKFLVDPFSFMHVM